MISSQYSIKQRNQKQNKKGKKIKTIWIKEGKSLNKRKKIEL